MRFHNGNKEKHINKISIFLAVDYINQTHLSIALRFSSSGIFSIAYRNEVRGILFPSTREI